MGEGLRQGQARSLSGQESSSPGKEVQEQLGAIQLEGAGKWQVARSVCKESLEKLLVDLRIGPFVCWLLPQGRLLPQFSGAAGERASLWPHGDVAQSLAAVPLGCV